MAEFGVGPEATLMIGDTTHDLLMARQRRCRRLGVAYGAHPRDALEAEAPLYCAGNVAQLAGVAAAARLKRRRICASGELVEGGPGVRFTVDARGVEEAAFACAFAVGSMPF
jgi:hypothetical protein